MATYTGKEARTRSLLKTLSWRVLATIATIMIVFIFTKKLVLSLGVGVVELISKLILYYFHERMWVKVPYGKKK
ncbi:MAG: DUF2061 domain-containing protein [Candidatus Omnitrophota bacterium]